MHSASVNLHHCSVICNLSRPFCVKRLSLSEIQYMFFQIFFVSSSISCLSNSSTELGEKFAGLYLDDSIQEGPVGDRFWIDGVSEESVLNMDGNNWRAAQGQVPIQGQVIGGNAVAAVGMESGDWRTHLHTETRPRIVNMIMETLKRHLPFSGQEGLQELKKIAVRFEEKIYTAATNQSDYLRKISLKMLTMETKSQNPMAYPIQTYPANNIKYFPYPASFDSSSLTGIASGGDWLEEIYQKIKSMHDMYHPELNEMYTRVCNKLQLHDSVPQQPKNVQLEKLRFLKIMLERLMFFLRTTKNDIQLTHKEKIVGVEKQIVNILNSNRPQKPLQQGQLTNPHMRAMQQSQQQQPQISQMHTNEGKMISQMQTLNLQGSTMTTQQSNAPVSWGSCMDSSEA